MKVILTAIVVAAVLMVGCDDGRTVDAGSDFPINEVELRADWGGTWWHRSVFSDDTGRLWHSMQLTFTDPNYEFHATNFSGKGDLIAEYGKGTWELIGQTLHLHNQTGYPDILMYIPLSGSHPVKRITAGNLIILDNPRIESGDTVWRDTIGLSLPEY